jgi:hypothetical protein
MQNVKLTAEEILILVEFAAEGIDHWAYFGLTDEQLFKKIHQSSELTSEVLTILNKFEITEENYRSSQPMSILGDCDEVDSYGGEGQGDNWYSVKHFPLHDVYIRVDGWYQSHEGVTFDYGFGEEVRPQQKTITFYQ